MLYCIQRFLTTQNIFHYYVITCLSLPTRIPASSKCCKVGKRFLTGNEMSRRVKIRHKLMYLMIVRLISLPLSSCPRKTNSCVMFVIKSQSNGLFTLLSLVELPLMHVEIQTALESGHGIDSNCFHHLVTRRLT